MVTIRSSPAKRPLRVSRMTASAGAAQANSLGLGDAAPGGYQRQGGNYRWSFPATAEIFRADDWKEVVEGAAGVQAGDMPSLS